MNGRRAVELEQIVDAVRVGHRRYMTRLLRAVGICAAASLAVLVAGIFVQGAAASGDTSSEAGTSSSTPPNNSAPSPTTGGPVDSVPVAVPMGTVTVTTIVPASTVTVTASPPATTKTIQEEAATTVVVTKEVEVPVTITEFAKSVETVVETQFSTVFVTVPP
jgi:hypothetical protein